MEQFETNLNKSLCVVEQWLNVAGYIPGVAYVSGTKREIVGFILIAGAVSAAATIAFSALSASDATARIAGFKKAGVVLATYSFHGIANIFRAQLEKTFLLGILVCLPYDLLSSRITYPNEGGYRLIHTSS